MAKRIQNFRNFNSENEKTTSASKKVGVGHLSEPKKRTAEILKGGGKDSYKSKNYKKHTVSEINENEKTNKNRKKRT